MKNKKNIINRDFNCQFHGYQEWYYTDGKIELRGVIKNGNIIGYIEIHAFSLDRESTIFMIK